MQPPRPTETRGVTTYDGPKPVAQHVSVLASAWRILRRGAERRSGSSMAFQESRREAASAAIAQQRQSLGAAVAAYVEWRAACADVGSAYRDWESAPAARAQRAYLVYASALDREHAAARVYARLMSTVGHLVHRRKALDAAFDAYLDWRERRDGVQDAYGQWRRSRAADSVLAFHAYRGALDREEEAAEHYAATMAWARQMWARLAQSGLGAGSW
jgi:hypothetical protein